MIHVVERVRLNVSPERAWEWLADLDRLTVANLLHRRSRFVTEERDGVGATLIVDHGLAVGPLTPRRVRISHWDRGQRIRWTDVDPAWPTYLFPHSEEFRLEPLPDGATLLVDEVKGSLNLPIPLLGSITDRVFERIFVAPVVRHQCAFFRRDSGVARIGPAGLIQTP